MGALENIFSYQLPNERIAQRPVYPYDSAKLLVAKRQEAEIEESCFCDIENYLSEKDLLVFNDTAVIPARLFAELDTGAHVEILLVEKISGDTWKCLGKPFKKLVENREIKITDTLSALIVQQADGELEVKFIAEGDLTEELHSAGTMPIPPYIRKGKSDEKDKQDYQTFFAKNQGSIAAPTASLHFTPELIEKIKSKGVNLEYLTLHVGTASFLPLWKDSQDDFSPPGEENFSISSETLERIVSHREQGGRVIAVGTTVVRALESAVIQEVEKGFQATDLFITPGYQFKMIDAMITNFHQPGTTHICLVQAFMGKELIENSYNYALDNDFRFLSYGDGMLIT